MTLDELIENNGGKFVEVHGSKAKNQCVDWINAYIRDVLNLPIIKNADAKDFLTRASQNNFTRIPYREDRKPEKGDIVVFKGKHGHVSIFIDGDYETFESWDQNWPTGSPVSRVFHNYKNVIGWLRPISLPEKNMNDNEKIYKGLDLSNIDSMKVAIDTWKDVIDGKFIRKDKHNEVVNKLRDKLVVMEQAKVSLDPPSEPVKVLDTDWPEENDSFKEPIVTSPKVPKKEAGKELLRLIVSTVVGYLLVEGGIESILNMFETRLDPTTKVSLIAMITYFVKAADKWRHESGVEKGLVGF